MSRSTDRAATICLAILTMCAVVLTVSLLRRRAPTARAIGEVTVRDWNTYLDGGHSMGPSNAEVTVLEFADFQCPFCADMAQTLDALQEEFGARVRILYRHFPLPNHRRAREAALASECAAEQGRFEAFHDALYSQQASLDTIDLAEIARTSGVGDVSEFEDCVGTGRHTARVNADIEAGNRLVIQGTPTVLVNSRRFDGMFGREAIRRAIQAELRKSSSTSRRGRQETARSE